MTDALSIRGLRKEYPGTTAVDGIDLSIRDGAFFGLLGPNGAGKTTTIGAITGLVRPTAGSVQVFGHDAWQNPAAARAAVGLCPQEPNFDDFLGLERILAYHAGYFGLPYERSLERARELLRFFDLYEARKRRSSTLSGGMKRRLLLARALMHEPRMLVLDEPTAGVDVELRRSLWQYVRRLNEEEGITVLLTTHYIEEAEALCDEVAVIDQGRIIEQDTPDGLRARYGGRRVRVRVDAGDVEAPPAFDVSDLGFADDGRGGLIREDAAAAETLPALLRRIDDAGLRIEDLEVSRSRLEDVFVELTRRTDAGTRQQNVSPGSGANQGADNRPDGRADGRADDRAVDRADDRARDRAPGSATVERNRTSPEDDAGKRERGEEDA